MNCLSIIHENGSAKEQSTLEINSPCALYQCSKIDPNFKVLFSDWLVI